MNERVQFLIDSLVGHLSAMVMKGYGLSELEALGLVYNSQLYEKIMDLETGLYYQSAMYNYELLRHEIEFGKIAD